jgi:hypothetical protein
LLELEHHGLTSDYDPSSAATPSNGGNQKSSGQEENNNLVSVSQFSKSAKKSVITRHAAMLRGSLVLPIHFLRHQID